MRQGRGWKCGRRRPYALPPGFVVAILVALCEVYLLVFTVELQLETLLDAEGALATFWLLAVIRFSAM